MTAKALLQDIRVLSLEQVHVLPWGTGFLADLGAEVVRIESADHMNDRRSGPFPDGEPGDEWWNEGGTFGYWARNKKSLCLEVAHPSGKEVFLKLVEKSDIVTDNFRPGTTARLGIDHESLVKIKPDIITLSCTAYGHTGPWRAYGARARTIDAACGLSYLTGYEGGPSIRASSNYMDHSGGLNIAYALLLALYNRRRTGSGMRIDLSMYETGVSCIGPAVLEAQEGIDRPRLGTAHLWKVPHNVYPCAGTDRWIAIAVSSDDEWRRLRDAMGEPDWAQDRRFDTVLGRWNSRHELDRLIGEWTATQDDRTLARHLQRHGVLTGPVNTAKDLVSDEHLWERSYLEVFDNENAPGVGPRVYAGRSFRIPRTPVAMRLVSALGQHNHQILSEVAGLSDTEIQKLLDEGVISNRPGEAEKPAPNANWFQARSRSTNFDPDYKERARDFISASVSASGG
jgi:benzylsuccinate CoA-transferase BbsF subunit